LVTPQPCWRDSHFETAVPAAWTCERTVKAADASHIDGQRWPHAFSRAGLPIEYLYVYSTSSFDKLR
jgi:hypothetical protein